MKEIIRVSLNEDLSKSIEIVNNKIRAMRSLFFSYMNNEYEIFNDLKFSEIFDEYSYWTGVYNEMIYNTIKCNVDDETLIFIDTNQCGIRFSYLSHSVYITCVKV